MFAGRPWSGHFKVGRSLWAMAHTAQFVQPGWRYLDGASRRLPGTNAGSIVTLVAPGGKDWSAIVETDQAAADHELRLTLGDGLNAGAVRVWETDLGSEDPGRWMLRGATPLRPRSVAIASCPRGLGCV